MNTYSLNGSWTLHRDLDGPPIPATVPGCVHTDLLAAGLLEDPFYRDNEKLQTWIGETDWRYRRTFTAPADLLAHKRVILRCHGLDTLATLRLNGAVIGRAENMFRTWEYHVKDHLRPGENTLEIDLASPLAFLREADKTKRRMAGWAEPMRDNIAAWLRKEPCNFGWDWGPKMVTSGIWRPLELTGFSTARLLDVQIGQQHQGGNVRLQVRVTIERMYPATVNALVAVRYQGQIVAEHTIAPFGDDPEVVDLAIPDPALWWPNGMGAQPLYDVQVTLFDEAGNTLDSSQKRIGLRTLTLERHPDTWGESFYFACNGVPFFAKGANWIPATPYPGTCAPELYEKLIQAAVDANMNMLRAWGGGYYEDDRFYDLCDEKGITVWQDFMFACGTYPTFDDDFLANVWGEAVDTIRRLRHHACIALWCGNNEIEQGLPHSEGWLESMSWEDYSRLFDKMLPELIDVMAPGASYWPGSPHSSCGDRADHMNPTCGDTHLWNVWHGKAPFEWYRTRPDRFCSEFGFQSFPEPSTVYEFTAPEDRNITSYVMEFHQRSHIGNATIIQYMLDWFRLPTTFESMLWLTQVLQGEGMKYAVEHWRRNMPCTMGTLYWQHNDMWPGPSWSSLDWKVNWKALHYMARRFYAPLLISGLEDARTHRVAVHVTSDLGEAQAAVVQAVITDVQGVILADQQFAVNVLPRANTPVIDLDPSPYVAARSAREVLVWLTLWVDGVSVSENLALLTRPKHLALETPHLRLDIQPAGEGAFGVTLTSEKPALYTWLELPGAHFSDNFLHVRPGQPQTVQVTPPIGMDLAALRQSLRVQSLIDTYVMG